MTPFPYTYTILRYIHDIATGEFVNVGVVLVSPEARFARARLRDQPGRLSRMFSDFDRGHYRKVIGHLSARFEKISDQLAGLPYAEFRRDARGMATSVLKDDDSAFQWSPLGSGLSADPGQTLDRTYERLVSHHDDAAPQKNRLDEDVWKVFRSSFRSEGRNPKFRRKTISTGDDEIEFQRAWKNGAWHCLEPLSFDLQRPRAIQQKAHASLGGLTSVQAAARDVRVYFLVGRPRRPELQPAYEQALGILGKAPVRHQIVPEGNAARFVASIAELLPDSAGAQEDLD